MNDFTFGNIEDPSIATTETIRRMATNLRSNFARLALQLIEDGEKEKAVEILDKGLTYLNNQKIPFDFFTVFAVEAYYAADAPEKAVEVSKTISSNMLDDMEYLRSIPKDMFKAYQDEARMAEIGMGELMRMAESNGQQEWLDTVKGRFEQLSFAN